VKLSDYIVEFFEDQNISHVFIAEIHPQRHYFSLNVVLHCLLRSALAISMTQTCFDFGGQEGERWQGFP
jgi:hypothetical protein